MLRCGFWSRCSVAAVILGGLAVLGCMKRPFNQTTSNAANVTEVPIAVRKVAIAAGIQGVPKRALVYIPSLNIRGVVFWFHGFQGKIEDYSDLMAQLASRGFVVVTPQAYEPGLPWGIPSPAEEAQHSKEFLTWFDSVKAHYGVVATVPLFLGGHSRGGQVPLRLVRMNPKAYGGVALFDPVDGLKQFGQPQIFGDAWSGFHVPALIVGTEYGSQGGFPRMACAPDGGNHKELAKAWGSDGQHVVMASTGHDDILNGDVVAREKKNPLICRAGENSTKNFARAAELLGTFLEERAAALAPPVSLRFGKGPDLERPLPDF